MMALKNNLANHWTKDLQTLELRISEIIGKHRMRERDNFLTSFPD